MIRGEREQGFFLGEGDFDFAEQVAVGFFNRIFGDARILLGGEQGGG